MIEDTLAGLGYSSFAFAASMNAAVDEAKLRCPDLITVDVRLAPGCGIEAVEAICADHPIPVIFITATPQKVQQRLPGHVIVVKPFLPAQLVAAVPLARKQPGIAAGR